MLTCGRLGSSAAAAAQYLPHGLGCDAWPGEKHPRREARASGPESSPSSCLGPESLICDVPQLYHLRGVGGLKGVCHLHELLAIWGM